MPITTSVEMERFGADAIHYKYENGKNLFYLGEAKTYSSKYQFNTAIGDAIESIIKPTRNIVKKLADMFTTRLLMIL